MEIGIIGLGKMGYNLCLNLMRRHHDVTAFDSDENKVEAIAEQGAAKADSIGDLARKLSKRRVIWLMIPAGDTIDEVINELLPALEPRDIIIDGGNSNFRDSVRRYKLLKEKEIDFLDCGTSGGIEGALSGACTMIGGEKEVYAYCAEIFKGISVEGGSLYTGEPGSGHFAKMVHNGIEYGMMQALAEGFEVISKSDFNFDYDKLASVWNHGSVIRGWLMQLAQEAFSKDKELKSIKGIMYSSGEGKWTVETALDLGVPTPVIALSLFMRYRSLEEDTFAGKVIAALRNGFGGHPVEKNN
ncbi:6-phosphogluconate dehydrogenase, NAD(+)-dependent, decarboxylating [Peptococcaceae bacterium CEB3]|nr:6-phosphogluconate dehydrogenase, NAD(+)-dependent, decarboxylating [Peptococcaceae bacterium CEB3]